MTSIADTDRADWPGRAPAGASVWERDLWTHLTSHVVSERALIEGYAEVAKETPSRAFAYLVNLLVEDEIRHHRLFMELAASLKTDAELSGQDPTVPHVDFNRADRAALAEATQRLIDNEEADARELKRLQHELRDVKTTTLWSVLVELMQRDTQKHIALLRFVKRLAGRKGS